MTHREKDKTIAFRIGSPYAEKLEQAANCHGMSRGQFARLALVMHFEETAIHLLADDVRDIRKQIDELREEHIIIRKAG